MEDDPEMKIQTCDRQITVNNWEYLLISNSKPDLYNLNAHSKFGENPLTFTLVIVRKQKYGCVAGR